VAIRKVVFLLEVVDKVWDKIPAGRTVQAIFGAIENPTQASPIPDVTRQKSEAEVKSFFDITNSKSIRLQAVLRWDPGAEPQRENSAPLDDGAYIPADFLDAAEQYDDAAEDSGASRRNLSGYAKRGMSREDEAFEDRKMAARQRIKKVRVEGLKPGKV